MTPFHLHCYQCLHWPLPHPHPRPSLTQVNITKHTLVPQHRILTRDEKQTLLGRYKVRLTATHVCATCVRLLLCCNASVLS